MKMFSRLTGFVSVALFMMGSFSAFSQEQPCAQIAGNYNGTDNYYVSVKVYGIKKSDSGTSYISDIEITQDRNTFRCTKTDNGKVYTWTGKLKGNKITSISGPVGLAFDYDMLSVSDGLLYGYGKVEQDRIVLYLTGYAKGSISFLSGDLSLESTLVLEGNSIVLAPDLTPPTVKISSPAANHRITSMPLKVNGSASDDESLSQVFCQLNGGDWVEATGRSSWKLAVTPVPGSNTVAAYSVDSAGNCSPTSSVTFFQVVKSPLTLLTHGGGKIVRPASGTNLVICDPYSVKAVAQSPGWMFAGWTGDVQSPNLTLNFVMRSNMTITANFVTNVFPSLRGTYTGLFAQEVPQPESSGAFTLTLRNDGTFSGKVYQGSSTYGVSGQFNAEGHATTLLPRKGTSPISVNWTIDLGSVTDQITASVESSTWASAAVGNRGVFDTKTNPTPAAGRYTVVFPGVDDSIPGPAGAGWGTIMVNTAGSATFSGSLADGTPVTYTTTISKSGEVPLYVPLYHGKGMLLSNIKLGTSTPFVWSKPADAAKIEPNGFTNRLELLSCNYTPPVTRKHPALTLVDGVASWRDGNLSAPLDCSLVFHTNNVFSLTTSTKASVSIDTTKGTVKGSFMHPDFNKMVPFSGVVLQNDSMIYGYFLGTNRSGLFSVSPTLHCD